MPENRATIKAMRERYQEAAVAMGKYMREAGEHIAANSQLDLTPDALIDEINSIQMMLAEATYYAGRMKVYDTLIDSALGKKHEHAFVPMNVDGMIVGWCTCGTLAVAQETLTEKVDREFR